MFGTKKEVEELVKLGAFPERAEDGKSQWTHFLVIFQTPGKSPLFLAAELGKGLFMDHLLEKFATGRLGSTSTWSPPFQLDETLREWMNQDLFTLLHEKYFEMQNWDLSCEHVKAYNCSQKCGAHHIVFTCQLLLFSPFHESRSFQSRLFVILASRFDNTLKMSKILNSGHY